MNIFLFTNEELESGLKISRKDERVQHLIKILHKTAGDTFTAGVVGQHSGVGTINSVDDDFVTFSFEPTGEGKPLNSLKMIIGFPRPIQLKRLLRDIAALGVKEVHLTGTELGEKSYMQSTLVEKGNAYKMLLDGTVQAGSTHVPELFLHRTLKECVEYLEQTPNTLRLALDNVNPKCSLSTAMNDISCVQCSNSCNEEKNVLAAIGSERGWTDKERKLLEEYGYVRCSMGNRIMRTETAATVAGAIILDKLGFLGM